MKPFLKLALLALAFAAIPLTAEEPHKKMKATKDCGACCTQGGDCCDKCGHDKCASCCDNKVAPKQESPTKEAPKNTALPRIPAVGLHPIAEPLLPCDRDSEVSRTTCS